MKLFRLILIIMVIFLFLNLTLFFIAPNLYNFRFITMNSCMYRETCNREYKLKNNRELFQYLSVNVNFDFEDTFVLVEENHLTFTLISSYDNPTYLTLEDDLDYYVREHYNNLSGRFLELLEEKDLVIDIIVIEE